MNIKLLENKYTVAVIISLIAFTVSVFAGAINWLFQFAVCGLIYLIAGLLYKNDIKCIIFFSLVIFPFIFVYSALAFIREAEQVYPIALIPVISIATGMIISISLKGKLKAFIISAYVILILAAAFIGMPNWLSFVFNENKNEISLMPDIKFHTEEDKAVSSDQFNGKIVILDFWSTSCGLCFKKFPEFDRLYSEYKDNKNIYFYAVNLFLKRDGKSGAKKIINDLNYSFKNLYTDKNEAEKIRKLLKINAVPAIVVIGKNGEIIYKGQLYTNKKVVINNIYDIINKALDGSE
jgi:thiol-disulfide isomerase/thioredoxin